MIREATQADVEALAEISARTFTESFGHLYRPENLASHLLKHSSVAYFRDALAAGDTLFVQEQDGKLVGYGKVGQMSLPYDKAPRGAQEIQRVYVDKAYHGQGLGKEMVFAMMALPRMENAPAIYLSVYEKNLIAQGLYAHYGFKPVARYQYQVGDEFDPEIIMGRVR